MCNEEIIIQWEMWLRNQRTEQACKFFDDACILYLAWNGVNKTTRDVVCRNYF